MDQFPPLVRGGPQKENGFLKLIEIFSSVEVFRLPDFNLHIQNQIKYSTEDEQFSND
mgnify:CR=1 FL=1